MLDGNACPSSRYGPSLFSGSLILRQMGDTQEFFYPHLKPWVHFVPMHRNLSNMIETIQ
jgi:hypothetical protein